MAVEPIEPRVSVILCVLNGAPWIGRQLQALRAQESEHAWEVVVVDNGSTDGTVAIVERQATDFPVPLRLVDARDRPGLSRARNAGAVAARGDILAFCDCDDVVAPGWVAAAERATRAASLVGGVNRLLRDPLDPGAPVLNPGGVIRGSFGNAVLGCNFAVRRGDYMAIGGFDESLPAYGCDDVEFSIRMNAAGRTVDGAEDMQIYFRRTEGLRSVLRKTYMSALAETVVWARHPDRYGHELSGRRRGTAVARWPVDVTARIVRSRSLPLRSATRDLATRLGNLAGWWTLIRTGKAGTPRLLDEQLPPKGRGLGR